MNKYIVKILIITISFVSLAKDLNLTLGESYDLGIKGNYRNVNNLRAYVGNRRQEQDLFTNTVNKDKQLNNKLYGYNLVDLDNLHINTKTQLLGNTAQNNSVQNSLLQNNSGYTVIQNVLTERLVIFQGISVRVYQISTAKEIEKYTGLKMNVYAKRKDGSLMVSFIGEGSSPNLVREIKSKYAGKVSTVSPLIIDKKNIPN